MSEQDSLVYPPEASSWGKNAYYHHCDHVGFRRNFAACRHSVMAQQEGRHTLQEESCKQAIIHGHCQAIKMHEEEIKAGKALYYKEREIRVAIVSENDDGVTKRVSGNTNSDSYKRGWDNAGGSKPSNLARATVKIATPKPQKKEAKSIFEGGSMSEVINAIVAKEGKEAFNKMTMAEKVKFIKEKRGGVQ